MKPIYSGHPLGQGKLAVVERWPDYTMQFQQIGTLRGTTTYVFGCFIEVDLVIQVCNMAGLDRFHCTYIVRPFGLQCRLPLLPTTLGTNQSVHIRGVAYFRGTMPYTMYVHSLICDKNCTFSMAIFLGAQYP